MKKDVSLIVPSIRPENLIKFYNSVVQACKKTTFEIIIASPYLIPEELMKTGNVKFLHTYANPTIAFQMSALLSDSEFIYNTTDDHMVQPDAIDRAVDLFRNTPLSYKDMINMVYSEAVLDTETLEPNGRQIFRRPDDYWLAYSHEDLRVVGVKPTWEICIQFFMKLGYFLELGGFDCNYEYCNHPIHDLAFRAQANGSKIYHSPMIATYSSMLPGSSGDHRPVQEAQEGPDLKRFNELYSVSDCAFKRIKIPYDNWKGKSDVWERRFDKNNLKIKK